MAYFKYLFAPIRIGPVTLKNRIAVAPVGRNYSGLDSSVTDRLLAHYEELARGGPGLIVVEATYIDPVGKASASNQLGIWNDGLVTGLRELANVVHRHGAAITIQLHHAGRQTNSRDTGFRPVSASAVPCAATGNEVPREMTVDDIQDVIQKFAEAARRSKQAGFDGVEFHCAHGYLPLQFLSPWCNRRSDEYGGSLENRMRFPLEAIAAIREKAGRDFIVGCRFSADEFVDGGLTLDESKIFAQRLEQAGVDYVHVTATIYETSELTIAPMGTPLGIFVHLASGIKSVVNIPVIAANRIKDPVQAENILADGHADLVAMGRAMLADPDLPNKAKGGRLGDIVTCLSCNEGCIQRLAMDLDVTCVVNPAAGREREFVIQPALVSKKVMVVGGGPAGMEAAKIAAMRGHVVTLYEKENELGGQARLAAVPPSRKELGGVIRNLTHQLGKLNVKIALGVEVTPELVEREAPDAVVIATGARPRKLRVSGADKAFVVTAQDVLRQRARVGQSVVVIGGDRIGAETAEFLADQGKTVDLVEESAKIAPDMEFATRRLFLKRLKTYKDVRIHCGKGVREIADDGVVIDRAGAIGPLEEMRLAPVDTVVVAAGRESDFDLFRSLQASIREIYEIGDCVEPRTVLEAIYEGSLVGRKL